MTALKLHVSPKLSRDLSTAGESQPNVVIFGLDYSDSISQLQKGCEEQSLSVRLDANPCINDFSLKNKLC